jgi:hypothetical protein
MAIPEGFFDNVVADLARTYSIKDGEGFAVERDPIVLTCVRLAYQQICAHTKVGFHKDQRIVCYDEIYGALPLMHSPIDPDATITVNVDGVDMTTEEYVIWNDTLYLSSEPDPDICYGSARYIKMTATAGLTAPVEDSALYAALLFQGIVNYNRRDILGFVQLQGEKGTARTISDRGALIETVKDLVQQYVYYGNGRLCT